MSQKVTLSRHNSRVNSKGNVMKPNHNDRDFESERELVGSGNVYWHLWNKEQLTFETVEERAYNKIYGDYIAQMNEKAYANHDYKRLKTAKTLLESKRTAPEETLFYLGDMANHASKAQMVQFMNKFQRYMHDNYGDNFKILDMAIHVDEEGAPHVHERHTFIGHKDDGTAYPSQEKALEEMGIPLPDPTKKSSKFNNRKMTFDAQVRKACKEIAKEVGLEILPEAQDSKHPNRNLSQYIYNLGKKKEQLEEDLESLENATQQQRDFIYEQEAAKRSFVAPSAGFTMPS